jgi:hypothetical protein
MSQFSQGLKILLQPVSSPSSTLIEVHLTSDINKGSAFTSIHLVSLSWKENLMFYTLIVYQLYGLGVDGLWLGGRSCHAVAERTVYDLGDWSL